MWRDRNVGTGAGGAGGCGWTAGWEAVMEKDEKAAMGAAHNQWFSFSKYSQTIMPTVHHFQSTKDGFAAGVEYQRRQSAERIKELELDVFVAQAGEIASDSHLQTKLAYIKDLEAELASLKQAAPCDQCNGTGDIHRADGEYVGECKSCAAPDDEAAERLTFESTMRKKFTTLMFMPRFLDGEYKNQESEAMWKGWRLSRAALPQQTRELSEEEIISIANLHEHALDKVTDDFNFTYKELIAFVREIRSGK